MKRIYNDIGKDWGIGLQEEGTPIAAGIIEFHNRLMYYLIIIFTIVGYILLVRVSKTRGPINNIRYINHSTIIEKKYPIWFPASTIPHQQRWWGKGERNMGEKN